MCVVKIAQESLAETGILLVILYEVGSSISSLFGWRKPDLLHVPHVSPAGLLVSAAKWTTCSPVLNIDLFC